jgi:hypothetical protein
MLNSLTMLAVFFTDAQQSITVGNLPPVTITRDCFDRWTLIFSALLTVVGLLGIFLAWRTVSATRDNAKAALLNANALINAERAWIVIKVESAGKNKFHFRAVNEGRTPAIITSIRGFPRVVRLNRVEPPLEDKEGESLMSTPPCLLPATASCTALFCNIEELRGTDSVEDFLRYIAGGLFEIWFYGRVVYFDVLEPAPQTPRQTDWFFWKLPVDDALPIVDPRHPEHNIYT